MCAKNKIKLLGNVNNNVCIKRDTLQTLNIDLTVYHTLTYSAELSGEEREALDIVPVITTALLEEQQLVTGIVVVVDSGTIEATHSPQRLFPC